MVKKDLIEKVRGVLQRGCDRRYITDGVRFESRSLVLYQQNLKDFMGALALEAGYKAGDEVEYEIRVKRK